MMRVVVFDNRIRGTAIEIDAVPVAAFCIGRRWLDVIDLVEPDGNPIGGVGFNT